VTNGKNLKKTFSMTMYNVDLTTRKKTKSTKNSTNKLILMKSRRRLKKDSNIKKVKSL